MANLRWCLTVKNTSTPTDCSKLIDFWTCSLYISSCSSSGLVLSNIVTPRFLSRWSIGINFSTRTVLRNVLSIITLFRAIRKSALLQIWQMHLAIFNNHAQLLEAISQYKQIAKKEFYIYICKVTIKIVWNSSLIVASFFHCRFVVSLAADSSLVRDIISE